MFDYEHLNYTMSNIQTHQQAHNINNNPINKSTKSQLTNVSLINYHINHKLKNLQKIKIKIIFSKKKTLEAVKTTISTTISGNSIERKQNDLKK